MVLNYTSGEEKCQFYGYQDYLNAMGYGHGYYSGFARWRTLGWLDDEQVKIAETDTTLWLDRLEGETSSGGFEGLKLILVPRKEHYPRENNSVGNYYSLEYYRPQDEESLDYREGFNSEVLMRMCGDYYSESHWLDMNKTIIMEKASPDDEKIYNARPIDLEAEGYCDPDTGVSIQVLQKTETRAEVEIAFYCPEEIAPVVSVSSSSYAQAIQGESIVSEISVANNIAIGF